MKIRVECHSGYKANERPIKFWIGHVLLFVDAIDEQWYGPDAMYFRVHADDRNTYVLSYNETNDEWVAETVRRTMPR